MRRIALGEKERRDQERIDLMEGARAQQSLLDFLKAQGQIIIADPADCSRLIVSPQVIKT